MEFRHDTKLAVRISDALFMSEEHEHGVVALKPMAASQVVKHFEGTPFVV